VRLEEVLTAVWRCKLITTAAFIMVLAASMIIFVLTTPGYEAESLLSVGQTVNGRVTDSRRITEETSDRNLEDEVNSLVRIAYTWDVLSEAATKVGITRLYPTLERPDWMATNIAALAAKGRFLLAGWREGIEVRFPGEPSAENGTQSITFDSKEPDRHLTLAVNALTKSLKIAVVGKSNMIDISFKHSNPEVSFELVDALDKAIIAKEADLAKRPKVIDFFEQQKNRLEVESRRTSKELTSFAIENGIYSAEDQRGLLLKRASELATGLASTRGSIAEREGEKRALAEELKTLKPVTASSFVSGVVNSLAPNDHSSSTRDLPTSSSENSSVSDDPPLLLVRVYQDSMVNLMKLNAELAGLHNLEQRQQQELEAANRDLKVLSAKEAEFERLERAVTIASSNAETFEKRATDELIDAEVAAAKLTKVTVIQAPTVPSLPSSPTFLLYLIVGMAGGTFIGLALALLKEMFSRRVGSTIVPRSGGARQPELAGVSLPSGHGRSPQRRI